MKKVVKHRWCLLLGRDMNDYEDDDDNDDDDDQALSSGVLPHIAKRLW